MRKRIQRPSPALVISCLALFVALGGVGYAAATINGNTIVNKTIAGKKLKNKTVTGGKVKNNTLTGTQINESRLGKVPSATKADSANSATSAASAANADALGGQSPSSYATRLFARVDYNDSTPAILAQSGGIVANGESFEGAPRLVFPRDMANCAITAMAHTGGGVFTIRQSTTGVGSQVTLVIDDDDPATLSAVRQDFSVIASC